VFSMLISCLALFSTLLIEAIYPSKTSINFLPIARRYIPEDEDLTYFIGTHLVVLELLCIQRDCRSNFDRQTSRFRMCLEKDTS
jgi:hypothetical protein